ncbi:type VI secretion system baseplate subunit TssG [Dyadobacter sp. CY261]|uniref:type VI secretion system baseplate subunit TssG n=1 Tax=Dyadobacter sp. CY261 TaxID=2907203 RepID=UPI001F40D059|nr:type VI secretion system baseplate subunit TssG [Dyadobacter sp. CY261]MCF0075102.1 type VI secretion system baseplate subunit TssG [Dyadobacter sp. CY261]
MSLKTDDLAELLDQMPVKRLRAEHILGELLEAGLCKREDLVVAPGRSSAYFFERDVSGVEEILNPLAGNSWFRANIPRDGFYDMLPERLFHRPIGRLKNSDEWSDIREEEVKQETDARLFFSPFDSTVNHQLIQIAQFEKNALAGDDKRFSREFLQIFWPEVSGLGLTEEQKVSLFHLTVIAHQVAGNLRRMQECFNKMMADPVELYFEDIQFEEPVRNEFAAMGEMVLGVDALLIRETFVKRKRLRIQVGPLSYEQMSKYFPGCSGEHLLHFLCGLLVPVEMDWIIDLVPEVGGSKGEGSENTVVSFTMDEAEQNPVLGFTTVL